MVELVGRYRSKHAFTSVYLLQFSLIGAIILNSCCEEVGCVGGQGKH